MFKGSRIELNSPHGEIIVNVGKESCRLPNGTRGMVVDSSPTMGGSKILVAFDSPAIVNAWVLVPELWLKERT